MFLSAMDMRAVTHFGVRCLSEAPERGGGVEAEAESVSTNRESDGPLDGLKDEQTHHDRWPSRVEIADGP